MRSSRSVLSAVFFLSLFLFAISAQGLEAAEKLIRPRPWMGITVKDAGKGGPGVYRKGVIVADVIKGGPAEEAGINASDVIVRINKSEVYGVADFVTEIRQLGVGEPVVVEVDRDGKIKTFDVVLAKMPVGLFAQQNGGYYTGRAERPCAGGKAGCGHMPGECVGGAPGCYGRDSGHMGHTGHMVMPGGSKYGKMFYVRMVHMLGLDLEQKKQADELGTAYRKQAIRLSAEIKVAEVELEELASSEGVGERAGDKAGLKRLRAKIDEIAGKEAELRFMRFKSLEEFRKILTPEQREKMGKLMLMDAAQSMSGPMHDGVEVYGSKSCTKPGPGGQRLMEGPARLR